MRINTVTLTEDEFVKVLAIATGNLMDDLVKNDEHGVMGKDEQMSMILFTLGVTTEASKILFEEKEV